MLSLIGRATSTPIGQLLAPAAVALGQGAAALAGQQKRGMAAMSHSEATNTYIKEVGAPISSPSATGAGWAGPPASVHRGCACAPVCRHLRPPRPGPAARRASQAPPRRASRARQASHATPGRPPPTARRALPGHQNSLPRPNSIPLLLMRLPCHTQPCALPGAFLFFQALQHLEYPERLQKLLLTPEREVSVELALLKDNGEVEVRVGGERDYVQECQSLLALGLGAGAAQGQRGGGGERGVRECAGSAEMISSWSTKRYGCCSRAAGRSR